MGLFGDPIEAEFGGRGGSAFSDVRLSGSSPENFGFNFQLKITKVEVRSGDFVDAIRIK